MTDEPTTPGPATDAGAATTDSGTRPDADVSSGSGTRSAAERRRAAREAARETMRRHRRRERATRIAVQGSLGLVFVALAVVVGLVVTSGSATAGESPRNVTGGDGIRTTAEGTLRSAAHPLDAEPADQPSQPSATTADVRIWLDLQCPGCQAFEDQEHEYLADLVASGAATVEYHPIAILDRFSQGTRYSTRAASALACVADLSPDAVAAATTALFEAQPAENTTGLTDAEIMTVLRGVDGLEHAPQVGECLTAGTFEPWVEAATDRATSGPLDGVDAEKITGTPTVFVNGQQWDPAAGDFREFLTGVLGEAAPAAGEQPAADAPAAEAPAEQPAG